MSNYKNLRPKSRDHNSHPDIFTKLDIVDMVGDRDKWLSYTAPLDFLSVDKVRQCLAESTRGAYAQIQWLWEQLEPVDAILATCVDRRQAALKKIPWDIIKVDGLSDIEDAIAEAQVRTLQDFANAITNLDQAIVALGQANFRHYKILQMVEGESGFNLNITDNWNWSRDGYGGTWQWNPRAAYGMAKGDVIPVPENSLIIRTCPRPIDQVAMMLCLDRKNAKAQWMTFNGRYGVPPLFVVLPTGTSRDTKDAYMEFARQCISNSAGVLPPGSDVKSIAPPAGTPDTFKGIIEMSNQELVLRATGGLMTMLTAPGAGTNTATGSAHQDAFDDLAATEAEEIAELFNACLFGPLLDQWHPGQSRLARFALRHPEADDTQASVQSIATLAGAGYRTEDGQVAELTGLTVKTQLSTPQLGGIALNSAAKRYAPTMLWPPARMVFEGGVRRQCNSVAPGRELTPAPQSEAPQEPPLSEAEKDELRKLCTLPTIDESLPKIMEVAKSVQDAIQAGVARAEALDTKNELSPRCNTSAMANLADEEDEAADLNYGTSEGARKAAITRRSKGSYKGDTKELKIRRKQSNPYQAPEGASPKIQKKAIVRSIDRVSKKGGQVRGVVERPGIGKLTIKSGSPGVKRRESQGGSGLSHIKQKHPEMKSKDIAETITGGEISPLKKKESRIKIEGEAKKVVLEREIKKGSGRISSTRSKLHTGYTIRRKESNDV